MSSKPTSPSTNQKVEANAFTTARVSLFSPQEEHCLESAKKTTNEPAPMDPPRRVPPQFSTTSARLSYISSSFVMRRLSATESSHSSIILDDRIQSHLDSDSTKNENTVEASSSTLLEADVTAPFYIPTNLNLFWLVLTSLAVWFLFIITPPALVKRGGVGQDALLVIHVLGVYCIYIACINNTIMTPSTTILGGKQKARPFHIFIGRSGMIAGIFIVISGLYLAWNPRGEFQKINSVSNAIAVTAIGAIQLSFQLVGYSAIKRYQRLKREITCMQEKSANTTDQQEDSDDRREQLKTECKAALNRHIICMVGIFVIPCSGAAVIRFGVELGLPDAVHIPVSSLILILVVWPNYAYVYLRKLNRPTSIPEGEIGAEDEIEGGGTSEDMMVAGGNTNATLG